MKAFSLAFRIALSFCLIILVGCESTDTGTPVRSNKPYIPKEGKIRVRLSAATARGQVNLSRFVYVFPPLKVDQNKQVVDQLIPQTDAEGNLYWISGIQGALAVKLAIEQSFREQGYTPVTFQALSDSKEDHRVMVVNPYYSGSLPAEDNPTGRVAYTRITVATYPASLDPARRLEVLNQEAISVYFQTDSHLDALNTAFDYSIRNIGVTRQWLMDLSLIKRDLVP